MFFERPDRAVGCRVATLVVSLMAGRMLGIIALRGESWFGDVDAALNALTPSLVALSDRDIRPARRTPQGPQRSVNAVNGAHLHKLNWPSSLLAARHVKCLYGLSSVPEAAHLKLFGDVIHHGDRLADTTQLRWEASNDEYQPI